MKEREIMKEIEDGYILPSVLPEGKYPGITEKMISGTKKRIETFFEQFGAEQIELPSGLCWTVNGKYFRTDLICFPTKPCFVIEWTDCLEYANHGCFEDADPFPYDLDDEELMEEIKRFFAR